MAQRCTGYGWTKILKACEIAQAQDIPLQWVWIDTICTQPLFMRKAL